MKLYEKLCFKLGAKVGAALYGGNLTPEQKRQIERQVYQEALEEDRQKKAAARRSCSSGNTQRRCCANCHHFMTSPVFGVEYFCTKHNIDFTRVDIIDDVHLNSVCNDYSTKGYW